jgi:hypothetical protein
MLTNLYLTSLSFHSSFFHKAHEYYDYEGIDVLLTLKLPFSSSGVQSLICHTFACNVHLVSSNRLKLKGGSTSL